MSIKVSLSVKMDFVEYIDEDDGAMRYYGQGPRHLAF